jgi:glyoxylase-like metal-dependent hydrolase (beta-lactamase superfamily II)
VRQIVLTHLDFDHAGGLDDFPEAKVHLMDAEVADATRQAAWLDRQRFRPQQWSSADRWTTYEPGEGESWFGFEAVRDLRGMPPEILMVPLRGHTLGHTGIAIRGASDWLFVAGDAYFDHDELDAENPRCTPGLRFYQWLMEKDRRARLAITVMRCGSSVRTTRASSSTTRDGRSTFRSRRRSKHLASTW